jgi:large subunit ribosomal protein L18
LAVHRSLKHISAQVIDDDAGRTLAHASSQESSVRNEIAYGGGMQAAKRVGAVIAKKLKDAGIESVVFDRGGFVYHGRVKALGEAVREGGVKL